MRRLDATRSACDRLTGADTRKLDARKTVARKLDFRQSDARKEDI